MINALQTMIQEALHRLSEQLISGVPAGLAALIIAVTGLAAARVVRWLLTQAVGRIDLDGRLRRSGLVGMIDPRGILSVSRIATQGVYWVLLGITAVAAMQVTGAHIAGRLVEGVVTLAPRLAGGAGIVVGGMWLGLYLGRSTLIWAVNEDLPAPRKLALAVRVLTTFAAVAVAADMVNLGGGLFRAVFIVVLSGVVLSASLAIGLGSRDVVRRYFEERAFPTHLPDECSDPEKLWNHL